MAPPIPQGPPPPEDEVDNSPWRFASRVSARLGRFSGRLSGAASSSLAAAAARRRTRVEQANGDTHDEDSDSIPMALATATHDHGLPGETPTAYPPPRKTVWSLRSRPSLTGIFRRSLDARGRPSLANILPHKDPDRPPEYAFEEDGASSDDDDLETVEAGSTVTKTTNTFVLAKVKGGVKGAGMATAHKVADKRIAQRLWLAMIAVCLLWLTSYAVARSIVLAFIPTPELTEVYEVDVFAYDTTVSTRDEYYNDVALVADECESDLDSSNRTEFYRTLALKEYNYNILSYLVTNITYVNDVYNETQIWLDALVTDGTINLESGGDYRTNSSASECKLIDGIVSGNASVVAALTAANGYVSTTTYAAEDLAYQIAARQAYDAEYLANKTQDLTDVKDKMAAAIPNMTKVFNNVKSYANDFKECITYNGTCSTATSIFDKLSDMADTCTEYFDGLKSAAETYYDDAVEQMAEYKKTIESVNKYYSTFQEAFGTSSIPSEDDADVPDFDTSSYSIDSVPSTSEVTSGFSSYYSGLLSNFANASDVFEAYQEQMRTAATSWGDDWDSDCDPGDSDLDVNGTLDNLTALSDSFLDSFSDELSSLTTTASSTYDNSTLSATVDSAVLSINTTASDVLVSLTDHTSWDFYSYSSSIMNNVQSGFNTMDELILIFDTLFRVIYTFMLIHKYWSLTGLATPPGDARIGSDYGEGWGPKKTMYQKLAAILLNPVVLTVLCLTAAGVILWAFWYTYSGLYYEYVESCVQNDYVAVEDNVTSGTMLYRNIYSVAFQYAASNGDSLASSRTNEINVGRDTYCSKQSFDDTTLYNAQVDRYDTLMTDYTDITVQNAALVECIDLAAVDAATSNAYDFVTRTSDKHFYYDFGDLEETAIYNCTSVSGCASIRGKDTSQSQAEGPDEELLRSVIFDASCQTEYWFHSNLFAGLFVIGVYIIINISRVIGSRALVRVLWRCVVVRNFSVYISVTDRGDIIYPERVTEKGDTMQEAIRIAVRDAIKKWEREGQMLLAIAILMNVPWIWALTWFHKTIQYTSS